ncbi:MAG: dipeptidase [Chloroflexi bacterium 13_1_40CM_4_68_4]|nr:MAG: dipeptidase [Chloroflexi bacterium 13_1_40CM_4_68_4]
MPGIRADLERLVRIPSVGHKGFDLSHVRRSGELTRDLFGALGLDSRVVQVEGCEHPAVVATRRAPAGAPTVLLYAHHDVQPTGPLSLWKTDPFEPVEKDGRLYGRGTSDDKCGIAMHLGALRACDPEPPVGIAVFIEGEEESSSEHLAQYLERYKDLLRCDVVINADAGTWRVGEPGITTSLRGVVSCIIEVRTLDHAVHSGEYGGAIPDAITALARAIASLHDDRGNVAVPGRARGKADPLDLTDKQLRGDAGVRPSVKLIGEGPLTQRMWMGPAVDILGMDVPSVKDATNQLVPSARAKVSMRLAPGDDPAAAIKALMEHLRAHVPWGAEVTITPESDGKPFKFDATGPAFDAMRRALKEAFGREPVEIGSGGSIPFVADFAREFPNVPLLLTGAGDPTSAPHSENESVDLADLENSVLAEALFLAYLSAARS